MRESTATSRPMARSVFICGKDRSLGFVVLAVVLVTEILTLIFTCYAAKCERNAVLTFLA